ncbi:MAG: hydrogenase nickel incorporation protein HypA [Thermoproteota archaeon]
MHEWALAEAIISTASEVADRENLREVNTIIIAVGEMQQVDKDILKFAIKQLRSDKFAKTKFIIKTSRAKFICRICGHKWFFKREGLPEDTREAIHFVPEVAHAYIRCPKCGSPDFEVSGGSGVWIASIKGERQHDRPEDKRNKR